MIVRCPQSSPCLGPASVWSGPFLYDPPSVACEPSLWPGPSPRTGKRIWDARDEGPQSASGRSSFPAETANGRLHPPQTAENRGCSAETGNSGLAQDCVVGPGGLEPATRPVISPTGQSSESGAHKHGIEDGRRKDWHSAANQAVVSSSWV